MTRSARGDLQDVLASRGVSRRDFLRYCGALAAGIGLGEAAGPGIAEALAAGSRL
jgi:Ni,Fe-hydrogenase I small subunit